ncbi:MAG: O-succinylhomoserine sulfhydrylase [Gammaproteobacteria bacterium]|nr:O-succinylhomoserine sulfhydrylase [Gammaproteobacteria bacterium]
MYKFIGVRPCTFVYILLMVLTVFTWYVGVSGLSGLSFAFLVLGLSLLKGHLIGDYYMGLKTVSGIWGWVIVIWLILPGSLIAIAFYSAS